jgi:alanine racemase
MKGQRNKKPYIRNTNHNRLCHRPTWIEVDLNAIRHNFLQIRKLINKDTAILVPVKANAYGHGMLEICDTLVRSGVDYLGAGTVDEAIFLRNNGFVKTPILMLGSVLTSVVEPIVRNNITQTVGDMRLARAIDKCAGKIGKKAKVHIKIDTGMGRIGVWHKDAMKLISKISLFGNVKIEGIFSHFPSADENKPLTHRQIKDFLSLLQDVEKAGIDIIYRHMANSMAVVDYKASHMNLIRPGLMIYGLSPRPGAFKGKISLKPALSLKTKIVFIKNVPPGRKVSYRGTHTTTCHTRVATIPIGYGDGINRRLSNKGRVLVGGKEAPIIGMVCMDQVMIDINRIDHAKIGDEAVIIGSQNNLRISAEEIAQLCDTIPYEVVCWFDKRIARKYKQLRGHDT